MKANGLDKDIRTRITIRLSVLNKSEIDSYKKMTNCNSYEEMVMNLLKNRTGKVKKIFVDENRVCLKLITELVRQSNNLNQMAKVANRDNKLSVKEMKIMKDFHNKNVRIRSSFIKNVKFTM